MTSNRCVHGFTLIEMMLANALASILLAALVSFLFVIRQQYHMQTNMLDLQEREQIIALLLIHDLSHALPNSISFSKNKITLKINKKYHAKQQLVTESLYIIRGSLFEKINHKRGEALVPFVNKLEAHFDPFSNHRGVDIVLTMASEYSRKLRPWFLTVALGDP